MSPCGCSLSRYKKENLLDFCVEPIAASADSDKREGTYSVEFLPEDNKERLVFTAQVVKVE